MPILRDKEMEEAILLVLLIPYSKNIQYHYTLAVSYFELQ